jgi:cutinase
VGTRKRNQIMSTVTPLVVRMGTLTVRAVLSTIFAGLAVAAILVGSLAAPAPWSAQASAADDSCPSIEVVFARGTFEAPGVGATGQAFVDALNARLPGKTVDVYAVNYPASLDFGQAADGIVDASNKIETIAATRTPRSCSAVTRRAPR